MWESELLDAARHVLVVHAHPDDESLATGGLIAELTRRGVTVSVLTATRGEQGEIVTGSLPSGADLTAHREGEVARACAALGVTRHTFLGAGDAREAGRAPRRYTDSGMRWLDEGQTRAGPGPEAGPDALTLASPRRSPQTSTPSGTPWARTCSSPTTSVVDMDTPTTSPCMPRPSQPRVRWGLAFWKSSRTPTPRGCSLEASTTGQRSRPHCVATRASSPSTAVRWSMWVASASPSR